MKRSFCLTIFCSIILFSAFSVQLNAQKTAQESVTPQDVALSEENNDLPFKNGETLSFILNYTWGGVITDVGAANCVTSYDKGTYNVKIKGYTYKFYDYFFKVRELFEAKFDEKTLRPSYFFRNASEGKYRMKNTLTFNNQDYSIQSRTQKYNRTPVDTTLAGTANTLDLITLVFKSRTLDINNIPVNQKIPLEFVIDKEIYQLYFIYKGKENKKIKGLGTFKTAKFAASVVAGNVFSGKEDMYIWVTDDMNKIPVFFEASILVGKIQGRCSKITDNKYPLDSKIK